MHPAQGVFGKSPRKKIQEVRMTTGRVARPHIQKLSLKACFRKRLVRFPGEVTMALGIRPTVDFVFKKTFGDPANRVALVSLLNAVLDLPGPITDVVIENPFRYEEFDGDKLSVLDVLATDAAGARYHIEMQVTSTATIGRRLVYYACSQVSGQLGRGQDYLEIRPVYTICFLDGLLWRESPLGHHRFRLHSPETGKSLGEVLEVHVLEMPRYNATEEDLAGLGQLARWIYWLRHAQRYGAAELRALFPGPGFQRAIDVVEGIAMKTEDRALYESRLRAERDRLWLRNSALVEGRQEGLQEGLEKGLLLGRITAYRKQLGLPELAQADWQGKSLEELREWADRLEAEAGRA